MTTLDPQTDGVLQTSYQRSVAAYWNDNPNDDRVNTKLGEVDGLYHHHYGIGEPDLSVLEDPEDTRQDRIVRELHRLETAQADLLLDNLGDVRPGDRLMDGGSGRGGTSIMANQRFGCRVDGVTISEYQVGFANEQAQQRGVADRVQFHFRNMLDTGFDARSMRGIWTNETDMYVELPDLFSEFARLLEPGGRYVCITGCSNDVTGGRSAAVSWIDAHYGCMIHPRSEYFRAMAANNLVPIAVTDLTAATIPYWELRTHSELATGVEKPFLTSYKEGSFQYLLIAADKVGR
ncbi:class I SAM-dependent methyltransferase [Nocardia sp. CA2R105]|uniref:geranyl diphosphate 2-C-methyltransferase n=1 Tax=Nocardia coffeae TaxID=2873381 RepID=UPI001CA67D69|nr:geranyl diphosphate 2-C-methyltransferase [Nocardia coffeae]MBY8861517.1 class I SAM-dependent methyltransferase [Nocardia coffeae]